jgi:hypothetical protein
MLKKATLTARLIREYLDCQLGALSQPVATDEDKKLPQ